jgi:hypothetical protein|nr:MAG TPA: hypothetical protein [Caudoviricetes sp.]
MIKIIFKNGRPEVRFSRGSSTSTQDIVNAIALLSNYVPNDTKVTVYNSRIDIPLDMEDTNGKKKS